MRVAGFDIAYARPCTFVFKDYNDATSDVIAVVRDQLSTMYQVLDTEAIDALCVLCKVAQGVEDAKP